MEYTVLGWPPDGPKLELDWQRFSYAGKFVMTNTGKAIASEEGEIVGASAFNADRTEPETAWIRYITVRTDKMGEGIGPRLASFTVEALLDKDFQTVKIAVNNPFAYEALYKAGFGYIGEETGLAELVLQFGEGQDVDAYESGLSNFANRDLSEEEHAFLQSKRRNATPPSTRDIV